MKRKEEKKYMLSTSNTFYIQGNKYVKSKTMKRVFQKINPGEMGLKQLLVSLAIFWKVLRLWPFVSRKGKKMTLIGGQRWTSKMKIPMSPINIGLRYGLF